MAASFFDHKKFFGSFFQERTAFLKKSSQKTFSSLTLVGWRQDQRP
jgi:hypothetical protein